MGRPRNPERGKQRNGIWTETARMILWYGIVCPTCPTMPRPESRRLRGTTDGAMTMV